MSFEKLGLSQEILKSIEEIYSNQDKLISLKDKFVSKKIFSDINKLDSETTVFKSLPIWICF